MLESHLSVYSGANIYEYEYLNRTGNATSTIEYRENKDSEGIKAMS